MKTKYTIIAVLLSLGGSASADLIYGPGDSFDEIWLFGTGRLIMRGGTGYRLYIREFSSLSMLSGHIEIVSASANTSVTMSGGSATYLSGTGNMVVTGGTIQWLGVSSTADVTLSGGDITEIYVSGNWLPSLSITFICDLDILRLSRTGGILTGISGEWLNGTKFDIAVDGRLSVLESSMHFVPEPATIALLALGGLALRRRKTAA